MALQKFLKEIADTLRDVTGKSEPINAQNFINEIKKLSSVPFTSETDETSAYIKQVPNNVLKYAQIKSIGGRTYKSENLFIIQDKEVTTLNGVTYMIKNGVITLHGTATATTYITLIANCNLPLGTYSYNPKITTFPDGTYLNLANANGAYISNYALTFENSVGRLQLQYNEGTVFTNNEIKPMLVSGSSIPSTFSTGFVGLRNSPVTECVNKGINLLDTNKLIIRGTDFSISHDGFVSEKCSAYNGKCFNSRYVLGLNTVLSSNGIPFEKGNYYISFKAKRNSGNGSLNAIFITVSDSKQIPTTKVLFPSMNNEYQIYESTFALERNTEIGLHIQVDGNASSMVFEVKDLMISRDDVEYQPYWEDRFEIPSEIQALDGYGLGVNKEYNNYIDFERKVFVRMVEAFTINGSESNSTFTLRTSPYTYAQLDIILPLNASLSEKMISISNSLTVDSVNTWNYENKENTFVYVSDTKIRILFDGTQYTTVEQLNSYLSENPITIVYPLATPIETDISDLLVGLGDVTNVEGLGTITFENEHKQKVPSSISYKIGE